MSSPAFEAFLARLYVDASLREAFIADPKRIGREAGLDAEDCDALARIDREGLVLAAGSFAQKRAKARPPGRWRRLLRAVRW